MYIVVLFMKNFIFIFFLFFSVSIFANESLDMQVNFFLAKKLFHNKQFNDARYFFYKIQSDDLFLSEKSVKSKVFVLFINVRANKFKESLIIAKRYNKIYSLEKINGKDHFKLLHSLMFYALTKKNMQFFLGFDKDIYYEDLILSAINKAFEIKDHVVCYFDFYNFKQELIKERELCNIRLLRYYLLNQAYFSAIKRLGYINNVDFYNKYFSERMLIFLKVYNELFLDKWVRTFLDLSKK